MREENGFRELNKEELEKVAGGKISSTYTCPKCGMVFEGAGTVLGDMHIAWHRAQHALEDNTDGAKE